MKPIVIYLQSDKIQLTKEEFEKYLQQAYDEGYEDGKKVSTINWQPGAWTCNDNVVNIPYCTPVTCNTAGTGGAV